MPTEIISLTCPNCGNSDNSISNNIHFGYEFKCKNCATTSVLVINNRLYVPSPGEKICTSCGRVAERNARFCQCGNSLIRKCISPECFNEFPANHNICDICGWPQNAEPSSPQGRNIIFDRNLRKIGDPDPEIAKDGTEAVKKLLESGEKSILKHAVEVYIQGYTLGRNLIQDVIYNASEKQMREVIFPAICQQKNHRMYNEMADLFCYCRDNKARKVLGEMIAKNDGVEFIPALINRIENLPHNLKPLESTLREQAIHTFSLMRQPALPYLKNISSSPNRSEGSKYIASSAIIRINLRKLMFWR